MRYESKFQTLFRHWFMANQDLFESCAIELKQTQTSALPFNAVAEHQDHSLNAVQQPYNGHLYKIPDDSRGMKPFDFSYHKDDDAWIAVKYPGNTFYVIDYDDFMHEKMISKRKSLTEARAVAIATHIVMIPLKSRHTGGVR